MIRHDRWHTPEQAEDHDDMERDPDLRVTAIWVTLVIAVSLLVGWIIGARMG